MTEPKKRTRLLFALVLIVVVALGAIVTYYLLLPPPPEEKIIRIATLFESPKTSAWETAIVDALEKVDEEEDFEAKTIAESIPPADLDRVASGYCEEGYDVIFAPSISYLEPALTVAKKYPDVSFLVYGAYKFEPNLAGITLWYHEAAYLAGMLGGYLTKTNKIGFVGPFAYPVCVAPANGFILGARAVNPNVTVYDLWMNAWSDMAKAYEAAKTEIEMGADYIWCSSGPPTPAAIQACEEAGVYAVGAHDDMNYLAPDTVITSVCIVWYEPLLSMLRDIRDNTLEGKAYNFGMPEGAAIITPYHGLESEIPQEVRDAISQKQQDIINGVFQVPFFPQEVID